MRKARTPDLEEILPVRGMHIKPIEVYTTHLQDHTVKGHFDGSFFSVPVGCEAMPKVTDLKMSIVFVWETPRQRSCASYFPIHVAKEPSESQLFLSLINHITLHEE